MFRSVYPGKRRLFCQPPRFCVKKTSDQNFFPWKKTSKCGWNESKKHFDFIDHSNVEFFLQKSKKKGEFFIFCIFFKFFSVNKPRFLQFVSAGLHERMWMKEIKSSFKARHYATFRWFSVQGCVSKSAHSHVIQWLIDWLAKGCLYSFSHFL